MNSLIRETHLRLLATLPVRTHQQRAVIPHQQGQKYNQLQKVRLRAKMLELEAAGMDRKRMCRELGTSNKTVIRLLGVKP